MVTLFVLMSIFSSVNYKSLSPKMSWCASEDTKVTAVGYVLLSDTISIVAALRVVDESLVAPARL